MLGRIFGAHFDRPIPATSAIGDFLGLAIPTHAAHPDLRKFLGDIAAAKTDDELQAIVRDAVGPTGLMEFMRFDQGR